MKLSKMTDEELISEAERLQNSSGISDLLEMYDEMLKRLKKKTEYLTKDEIKEINKSIEEIRKGNYKEGNINELLKDLKESE